MNDLLLEIEALARGVNALKEATARVYRLHRVDIECLELLGQWGPMRPKALALGIGYTTSGVSSVIDRLEELGYVTREPVSTDRRMILIAPTAKARDLYRATWGKLAQAVEKETSDIPVETLEAVGLILKRVQLVMRAQRPR